MMNLFYSLSYSTQLLFLIRPNAHDSEFTLVIGIKENKYPSEWQKKKERG